MAGWLTTAKNVFSRQSAPQSQAFALRCGCGQTLSGTRTAAAQTIVCPECRAARVVLPACVYPLPRGVPPPSVAPPPTLPDDSDSADELDESPLPDVQSRETKRSSGGPAARKRRRSTEPVRGQEESRDTGRPIGSRHWISAEQLQRLRRKWFTPIRLVLAGTLSVVISTVFWLLHLRALSQAELLLTTAPKLAESALAEGDLAEAARQFGSTKTALDTLGRDDRQARLWRQLARESAAGAELVSSSLPEILQEAVESNGSSTWSDTFRSMYKGSWVVFDVPVSRSSLADVAPRYSIDYPIRFGEVEGVVWVNELPALESRVPTGEKPQRVIFAAQLAAIHREAGSEQTWRIELRGDTAFLWCTSDALAPLGLVSDAATQTLLNEQAQSVGIDP